MNVLPPVAGSGPGPGFANPRAQGTDRSGILGVGVADAGVGQQVHEGDQARVVGFHHPASACASSTRRVAGRKPDRGGQDGLCR
jgi:hypothetical protein